MILSDSTPNCKGFHNPYAYQSASQRILYALQSAPTDPDGWITISVRQLARRAGLAATAGAVSPALMDLEQRGCIVRDAQHRIRLVPNAPPLPSRPPTIRARLWALLREQAHPLITSTNLALATALGCAEGRVSAALRRLQHDGWIRPAAGTRGWVWCGRSDQQADDAGHDSDQQADDAGHDSDQQADAHPGCDRDHPPADRHHPPLDRPQTDQEADEAVPHPPPDRRHPFIDRPDSAAQCGKPVSSHAHACESESESENQEKQESHLRAQFFQFIGPAEQTLYQHLCTRYPISARVAARVVWTNPTGTPADFDRDVVLGEAILGYGLGLIITLWNEGKRVALPPRVTNPTAVLDAEALPMPPSSLTPQQAGASRGSGRAPRSRPSAPRSTPADADRRAALRASVARLTAAQDATAARLLADRPPPASPVSETDTPGTVPASFQERAVGVAPPAVPSLPVLWEQLHQAVVARAGRGVVQALVGAQLTAYDPTRGLVVVGAASVAHKAALESQAHVMRQVLAEQYGLTVHVVVNVAQGSR